MFQVRHFEYMIDTKLIKSAEKKYRNFYKYFHRVLLDKPTTSEIKYCKLYFIIYRIAYFCHYQYTLLKTDLLYFAYEENKNH